MIVLVTGSRDHGDQHQVWRELDAVRTVEDFALVVGDCPTGADLYAREWAVANEAFYAEAPTGVRADWATHGKAAGPLRNRRMVDLYRPTLCLAFFWPGSTCRGTRDCADYAESRGVRTVRINWHGRP